MVISEKFLYSAGAEIKKYNTGEFIFQEGEAPFYYYQVMKGKIKLSNNKKGKEFIQNILSEGQSLGDSLLFMDKAYPMDAVALEPCLVFRLCRNNFFSMLNTYPQLYNAVCKALSDRLYDQDMMLQISHSQNPAKRMISWCRLKTAIRIILIKTANLMNYGRKILLYVIRVIIFTCFKFINSL
jgi:CRP/FNR family transcriptional regulator, cyclic AMP receptor protein